MCIRDSLQLVRGKKLMSAFLLFDFLLSELIRICVHISLVDCLIDQGTEPVSYTHLDVYKRQGLHK